MIHRAFDYETTGLDPYSGVEIFSYCIGDGEGNVEVRRLDEADRAKNHKRLVSYMQNTQQSKICHNMKFEYTMTILAGLPCPEDTVWHDTMMMSRMLRNLAPSHELGRLCWELCGWSEDLDHQVAAANKAYGGYHRIPKSLMHPYQVSDGQRTMLLFKTFFPEIKKNAKLYNDYLNEIELIKVTQRMEQHGMMVSIPAAEKLLSWLQEQLEEVQRDCYKHLGELINFNADPQVARLLFKRLELPIIEYTDKHRPSTDKIVLMQYKEKYPEHAHIFDMIMKYRSYFSGATNMKSYIKLADSKSIIHANINTNQARTGRESCSKPNLQNVAKEQVLNNLFPVPARRAFRSFPGTITLFADYAGQELRLITEISEDEEMYRLIREGKDTHAEGAHEWYGSKFINESDTAVKKLLRTAAKNANFAKPYGAAISRIAATLQLHLKEAIKGDARFCKRFPRYANFSHIMTSRVKQDGFVETPFGRKLYVPKDKPYSGANYIIQGTGAGMVKRSQVRIDKYCKEKWNYELRIIIPIHDEVVLKYPRKLLPYKKQILGDIRDIMIDMPEIKVPLDVEFKMSTTTWDKAKGVEI